jgi:hypothetical protein
VQKHEQMKLKELKKLLRKLRPKIRTQKLHYYEHQAVIILPMLQQPIGIKGCMRKEYFTKLISFQSRNTLLDVVLVVLRIVLIKKGG